jgi:hypothetical protein
MEDKVREIIHAIQTLSVCPIFAALTRTMVNLATTGRKSPIPHRQLVFSLKSDSVDDIRPPGCTGDTNDDDTTSSLLCC